MLTPVRFSQFKRDVKRVQKHGKDMDKLRRLLGLLLEQTPLPDAYQDHPLRGTGRATEMPTSNPIGCCCIA